MDTSTRVSMVGVSGVFSTCAAPAATGCSTATGTEMASTFAAKPHSGQRTNVSSPTGVGARNSSLAEPPIAPDVAETITYVKPSRSKVEM